MKSLTLCYITARKEPKLEWFIESLKSQIANDEDVRLIVIDSHFPNSPHPLCKIPSTLIHTAPKPTVWQGKHRLTRDAWWAISNARNTGICLCETEWIMFIDDRSVLMPGSIAALLEAMNGNYAVSGRYEKRYNMKVENGVITDPGIVSGRDSRYSDQAKAVRAPGQWWFGTPSACPLEWLLKINGYDERCDGLGMEDVVCGLMLEANGFPIFYDPRLYLVEDRTPEALAGDVMPKRADKGISPRDKSHALLEFPKQKRAGHGWDIRAVREAVSRGEPFPIPTGPTHDWYDGQLLSDM